MFKKKALVAGVRDGVIEVREDMTHVEHVVVASGVGMAIGGGINMCIAPLLVAAKATMFVAVGKAAVIGGTAVAVGVISKCWVRGFMEGYRHEVRKGALLDAVK